MNLDDLSSTNSTIKYSRASTNTTNQQFYISGKYQNNITWGTAASPINGRPNDRDIIAFVFETSPSAQLWWDFTCEFRDSTSSNTPVFNKSGGNAQFPSAPQTAGTDYEATYDHTAALDDYTLMWANNYFRAGAAPPTSSDNPYIDYSQFYDQTQDYRSKMLQILV